MVFPPHVLIAAALQSETRGPALQLALQLAGLLTLILTLFLAGVLLFRRLRRSVDQERDSASANPGRQAPDSNAFAMATFQAVIRQMKEQEAELERLHRLERQRAEESQQLAATIMKNMATGLVMLNARGIITECNPAAKQTLGHQLLTGRGYREVFWPDYREDSGEPAPEGMSLLQDCLSTGATTRRLQMTYRAPGGQSMLLGVGFSPIRNADGAVGGAICLLTDLTEIEALQNQLRLNESMAALGEMSAGIAHEFKNSLATISGYAQLIRGSTAEEASAYGERILRETQTLATIVSDFLNFSRPLNVVATAVGTRELVDHSFAEIRDRGNFPGVTLETRGDFPIIHADVTLLRQAFSNLLRNSCEALAERGGGGRLLVESAVNHGENASTVEIKFQDEAGGIPPEHLDKVFIPFFTTKNSGTGLGLALVHKIIFNHNGKISVESTPGQGSTFTVTLPMP